MKAPAMRNRKGGAAGKTGKTGKTSETGGRRDAAEAVAVAALSFLAADPDRLGGFLAQTGLGPDAIRAAAGEPGFLAGVLDHIVGDEPLLVAFAAHEGIDPFDVTRAQTALAGPQRDAP